jgi:tRNA(adenine34) deaminase
MIGPAEFPTEIIPTEPGDRQFMAEALRQAIQALDCDEVPVGAVIVRDGRIIGRAHNQRELLHDPTAHAEMIAITQAAEHLGDWRLEGCTLYVTLEPCTMCAGAIVLARLPRLVFGASDPKAGAVGSLYDIPRDTRLNHSVEVTAGILEQECGEILTEFFRRKRSKNGKE